MWTLFVTLSVIGSALAISSNIKASRPLPLRRQSQSSSGLIVTAPRVWIAGAQDRVCVVSQASTPSIDGSIQLITNQYPNQILHLEKNFSLASGSISCLLVSVPRKTSTIPAKIVVTATSSDANRTYNFSKFNDINIQANIIMTFIQTDKAIYKPSDLVRIRILTLDGPEFKIVTDDVSLVYVEDPSQTRVMQWINVSSVNGLTSLEMQLSNEPRLGEWTIKAIVQDEIQSQKFIVKEYVLPKFEVTIQHPSYLHFEAPGGTFKVCARYTYGEPVSGIANASVCFRNSAYHQRSVDLACVELNATKLSDGCAEFFVNRSSFLQKNNRYFSSNNDVLDINAVVEEIGTGVRLNGTYAVSLFMSTIELKLIPAETSSHYKPGLPYYVEGMLTRPDGSPVEAEVVQIKVVAKKDGNNMINIDVLTISLTSDLKGLFKLILPSNYTDQQEMNSIYLEASLKNPENVRYAPRASCTLKAWYSPSKSYLQVGPYDEIAACRREISIPVTFITRLELNSQTAVYYQLIAHGDIVHSGRIRSLSSSKRNPLPDGESNVYSLSLNFTTTPSMSGSVKVLMFVILPDGETVADSLTFNVQQCFNNRVSMTFSDARRQPGNSTILRLSSDPNSLCSISVVDKSVKLMDKGDNYLSKSKVLSFLKKFDIPQNQYSRLNDDDCGVIRNNGRQDRSIPMSRRPRMIAYPDRLTSEYVDSKAAFQDSGMIVLSDLKIVTKPCSIHEEFRRRFMYTSHVMSVRRHKTLSRFEAVPASPVALNLQEVEMVDLNNALSEQDHSAKNKKESVLHRTFFPETWLWELKSVGESGISNVPLSLPHTITEWIGNGYCTNVNSGLGIASEFSITAFQPFFLSFALPYSMVRGERVGIPVSVFNYMSQCLKVTLDVKKSLSFELTSDSPIKELRVCGQETETHLYYIVPRELGNINFTVKASSVAADDVEMNTIDEREQMTAEDIVTQKLLVEAEGKEEEQTKTAFVCAAANGAFSMNLPDNIVPDSVRSFTSVIGDVMGPTLTGLDSLLALPTGCGEQNMLKFSPNIFVLQYLEKTNSLNTEINNKAVEFLRTGYQRELTYRHDDGSFSAFGNSDPEGSTWLTAFVIKSFAQARPYIFIDQKDLDKSIEWLNSLQMENGCFPMVGRVLHKDMKGGLANAGENFAPLTAYVLISLLEAGISPMDPVIMGAIQCLNVQSVTDVYTLSLMAYAYTMWNRNNTRRTEIMNTLNEKATVNDGLKHWKLSVNGSDASPATVEMTSYVLLSILHNVNRDAIVDANPIVRWLSTQRNSLGGFSSTQDTVLALQALAKFAALVHSDDLDTQATISGIDWHQTVSVTKDNRMLLQKKEGPTLPPTLYYNVTGKGCVLLQASLKYNTILVPNDQEPAFALKVSVHREKNENCKERSLNICVRYNGADDASNMAVIAVKMVSGWIPDKDSIKKLRNHANLRLKRHEIEQNLVQFYFNELDKLERCFSFLVHQNVIVTKTKPALVHVYDYYEPTLSTYTDYSITSTCGTKEELEHDNDDGNAALEKPNISALQMNNSMVGQKRERTSNHPSAERNVTRAMKVRHTTTPPSGEGKRATKIPKPRATRKPLVDECPVCEMHNLTTVKDKICTKRYIVYKVQVINRGTMRIQKVLQLSEAGLANSTNMRYNLPKNCKCDSLKKGSRVNIVTLSGRSRGTLKMKTDTIVLDNTNEINSFLNSLFKPGNTECEDN